MAAAEADQQPEPLAARFAACVERVRDTAAASVRLGDAERLELYGLYKQATEGDNATKAPGLLDFVGRSKWNAWKGLAGMDGATAMQRYVDRVAEWFPPLPSGSGEATLAASGGGGGGGGSGGSGGGGGGDLSLGSASISTMGAIGLDGRVVDDDEEEGRAGGREAEPHDAFFFAKRGLVDEVCKLLEGGAVSIDAQDEEGRSLLHWAVDGGHAPLVEQLLARSADVRLKDSQGETALDYAELCEYAELAARLRIVLEQAGKEPK